jgi:hypothetical protein
VLRKLYDYFFAPSLSVYPALPMTRKTGKQIWATYRRQRKTYTRYRIKTNSPVPGEGIKCNNKVVSDRPGVTGDMIWAKDGKQIAKSQAFVFPKDGMVSQGSIFEMVKARGHLWKITVFINPKPGFIAKHQADFVCKNEVQAAKFLSKHFLTRAQRIKWRSGFWLRSIGKDLLKKLKEFFA